MVAAAGGVIAACFTAEAAPAAALITDPATTTAAINTRTGQYDRSPLTRLTAFQRETVSQRAGRWCD
jgi:hypothetical protein